MNDPGFEIEIEQRNKLIEQCRMAVLHALPPEVRASYAISVHLHRKADGSAVMFPVNPYGDSE
jgi:hypothetical protein